MTLLMPPFSFRFAEGEDQEKYGDGWYTFDESKLTEMRGRELLAAETQLRAGLGLTMFEAVQDFKRGGIAGALAVMWLALWQAGNAPDLADFNPLVMVGETRMGKAPEDVPPAGASSSSPKNAEA